MVYVVEIQDDVADAQNQRLHILHRHELHMMCKRNEFKDNISNTAILELLLSCDTIVGLEDVQQELPIDDIFTVPGGVVGVRRTSNRISACSDKDTMMKVKRMAAKNNLEQGMNNASFIFFFQQ